MPKRILFTILDWGLGHASRSVPLIEHFRLRGSEVVLSSSGRAAGYLRERFPQTEVMEMPAPEIRYNRSSARAALFRQALSQKKLNKRTHRFLTELARERDIHGMVSDNVYGAFLPGRPSALITHQLSLPAPVFRKAVNKELAAWLSNFTEVWIPDFPDGLAGALAENGALEKPIRYLGTLSRLSPVECDKTITCTALLSGPDPQRGIFEREAAEFLDALPGKKVLIRGLRDADSPAPRAEGVRVIDFADGPELERILSASEFVVCRAGFSTLSDLTAIGAKAVIIPTPGQYEQEYLAERCAEKVWFAAAEQGSLSKVSTQDVMRTSPPKCSPPQTAVVLDSFLDRL